MSPAMVTLLPDKVNAPAPLLNERPTQEASAADSGYIKALFYRAKLLKNEFQKYLQLSDDVRPPQ